LKKDFVRLWNKRKEYVDAENEAAAPAHPVPQTGVKTTHHAASAAPVTPTKRAVTSPAGNTSPKKIKLLPPPPSEARYAIGDSVFSHQSSRRYEEFSFEVRSRHYDREKQRWVYKLYNEEAIGTDSHITYQFRRIDWSCASTKLGRSTGLRTPMELWSSSKLWQSSLQLEV
jgi:hypothetical protein